MAADITLNLQKERQKIMLRNILNKYIKQKHYK